jgi:hypothetical protein
MPSKSIFAYAAEQLEVEKLEQREEQAAQTSGAAVLFDELKQQQEVEDAAAQQADEEGDSSLGGDSDSGELGSGDAPDADTDPVEEPSEEEALAREEFRTVTFALESTKDDSAFWSYKNMPSGGTPEDALRSRFAQTTAVLGTLGISLTWKMASNLFRGVLYVFEKLGRLAFAGGKLLARYLDRRKSSFQTLKETIQGLNKALDLVDEKSEKRDVSELVFTNEMTINALKIESSVDFNANIQVLHEFVKTMINDLGQHIVNDISAVKHLIYAGSHGVASLPANVMNVPMVTQRMVEWSVDGYDVQGEFTQSYRYSATLPSNVVLIAGLPVQGLEDLHEITKAYNDSKMLLGFDQSTFKEVSSVPVMASENLRVFINELDKLCDLCIAHQAVYEKVQRVKSDLVSNFKNMFLKLTQKTQKVSLQESFVEQVYLKTMFVDKIYLSTAMDIHDYTAKTISSGITYVKDNLKQLA